MLEEHRTAPLGAGSSLLEGRLRLREVTEEDRTLLQRIYSSTREAELAQVDWHPAQKKAFLEMQFKAQDIHYRRHYPGAEFLLIQHDELPAGRLYLYRTPKHLRIMDIALLPAFRRQGIGSALLGRLQDEAQDTGRIVSIHVEKENPARGLYARLGFKEVEDRGVHLLMEWTPPENTNG